MSINNICMYNKNMYDKKFLDNAKLSSSEAKAKLRLWAKNERKKLNLGLLSEIFTREIQDIQEYKNAKNILLFYPLKYEINLLALIEDTTKNFYLPKIEGENILCCSYSKGDELCKSCFSTLEPLSEPINEDLIDLAIVPALAVDKNNYRLGYGGGYYDRFLKNKKVKKITITYDEALIENDFQELFDIAFDYIVTEEKILSR